MNILKSNYTQMILVGMIISLISGVLGFFAFGTVKQSSSQKKIIIIDVAKKNPLVAGITRLSALKDFNTKVYKINEEYMQSLQWSILKYQSDKKKLGGGCHQTQFGLTDDSIFMETITYPLKDESKMISCINNLLDLSFQRLKSKIDTNTNEEILKLRFISEDLYLKKKIFENNLEKELYNNDKDNDNVTQIKEKLRLKLCQQLDSFSINTVLDNALKSDFPAYIELIENIYFFIALNKECDEMNPLVKTQIKTSTINQEIVNLMKTEQNLKKAQEILNKAKFNDVFKMEIISNNTINNNNFISKKNVVLSFSIFGFIFGILLFYNLRISK